MIKNKIRMVLTLLICGMMANVIIPAKGKADMVVEENWIIEIDTIIENEVIDLSGNLIVTSGCTLRTY